MTAETADPPTAPLVVDVSGLADLVGRELGPSPWCPVTQQMVDTFAELTGDHQWIHVDPARAAQGPFGGTIAHGYLTLSMVPVFFARLLDVRGGSLGLNYGLDRVRFPAPVRVGDEVRATLRIDSVRELGDEGFQAGATVTVQARTSPKPACVAQIVFRFYR